MASIERTAYPRFTSRPIKTHQLEKLYGLTQGEQDYIRQNVRGDLLRLNFAVQLKVFQHFHYFPDFSTVPPEVIAHINECLGLSADQAASSSLSYEHVSALYRHCQIQKCSSLMSEVDFNVKKFCSMFSFKTSQIA